MNRPMKFIDISSEADLFLKGDIKPFSLSLSAFLISDNINVFFGHELDKLLRQGLIEFCKQFELKDAKIYGPCLESMGFYPGLFI